MMRITIPGTGVRDIRHVVFDFNGTIACDGKLIAGVKEEIGRLTDRFTFHIITADTFGYVRTETRGLDCILTVIAEENQDKSKLGYIEDIGAAHVLCVGNGTNDRLMLEKAAIGIAVLQDEGLSIASLTSADLVVKDIMDVFAFCHRPERLVATLRN